LNADTERGAETAAAGRRKYRKRVKRAMVLNRATGDEFCRKPGQIFALWVHRAYFAENFAGQGRNPSRYGGRNAR